MSTHHAGAVSSHALTRDGSRIAYTLRAGAGQRPRIALAHSLAMNGDFWRPVAQRLAAHADVLTWDCRGHGASDKPAGPYSIESFADDLADLFDHLDWHSAAVAGASMGGSVALAFAAHHGARVQALGLIDTTAWYGPQAPQNWAERAAKARTEGLQSLVGFQQTRWFGDAFRSQHPEVLQACVEVFLNNDLEAFTATCHMLGAFDLRAFLPALSVPTAIVVGEEDYATPLAMAQVLHEGIAGSTLRILPGARHLTPLECQDEVTQVLAQLLSKESA